MVWAIVATTPVYFLPLLSNTAVVIFFSLRPFATAAPTAFTNSVFAPSATADLPYV
jgi:hypothetical protein